MDYLYRKHSETISPLVLYTCHFKEHHCVAAIVAIVVIDNIDSTVTTLN